MRWSPKEKIFLESIWWDARSTQNWDLYDDNDYWRCDDDITMDSEAPEEEDSEEEDPEGKDVEDDSKNGRPTSSIVILWIRMEYIVFLV